MYTSSNYNHRFNVSSQVVMLEHELNSLSTDDVQAGRDAHHPTIPSVVRPRMARGSPSI